MTIDTTVKLTISLIDPELNAEKLDEDVEPIQQEIEILFANKSLKKVEIQTIKIIGIKNEKAITQSQTKQIELFTEDLGNGILLEMIKIPAGQFWMGQTKAEKKELIRQVGKKEYRKWYSKELPCHQVSLESFFLGKSPVTQAQYQQIMGDNPSHFKDFEDSFNRPVENVTWGMAKEFCQQLSEKTGKNYGLPSEAQWEYACRAGTETPFAFGEIITTDYVNYDGNDPYANAPKGKYRQQTTPVNKFFPIVLAYMICTEMCGNGVMMVGETIKMHQQMDLVGMIIILKKVLNYCAAVLGSIIRRIVARRIGAGTMRISGAALSVFGLLFFFSRIPCPLHFCPLPTQCRRKVDRFFRRNITLLCPQINRIPDIIQNIEKRHNNKKSLRAKCNLL